MSSPWEPPRDPSSSPGQGSGGLNPYSDPYGSSPYGSSPYDSSYGASPYDAGQYGASPYGAGQYGASPAPYGSTPYPPGYAGYGPGYQPAPPASGLAIAALVCGIIGFFTAGLTSIPAVICGHLAWPDTSSGRYTGHGMTIAGLVLGYLPILGWLLFWLIFATSLASN